MPASKQPTQAMPELLPGVFADLLSPSGNLAVWVGTNQQGQPVAKLWRRAGFETQATWQKVLDVSMGLHLKIDGQGPPINLSTGLALHTVSDVSVVQHNVHAPANKRTKTDVYQHTRTWTWQPASADAESNLLLSVDMRLGNDGLAFRHVLQANTANQAEQPNNKSLVIENETTVFAMSEHTVGYLQPMDRPNTGWARTNPCYEQFYEQAIPADAVSTGEGLQGAGWVFPALFALPNKPVLGLDATGQRKVLSGSSTTWLLLSEVGFQADAGGARLVKPNRAPAFEPLHPSEPSAQPCQQIGFAGPEEVFPGAGHLPANDVLPWTLPWRVVAVGNLATIAESTLGTDVAEPPSRQAKQAAEAIFENVPLGLATWSWPLLKDPGTVFDVQKQFIDEAARLGWSHCLIDAQWDQQIGEDGLKALAAHAKSQGVHVWVWLNSAGPWNDSFQTPRDALLEGWQREQTMAWLKGLGVVGVKVDFFSGDGRSSFAHALAILEAAEQAGLLVNFHGCSLPRGLHVTHPVLVTAEAVRGLEHLTFDQHACDVAANHVCMLPWTRNVFDPMDYTPMVLDHIPGKQKRTTLGFELATLVLMTSGIQHVAETPWGIAKAPAFVQQYLSSVPRTWQDVALLGGFPDKDVAMARLGVPGDASGNADDAKPCWWVAMANGDNHAKMLTVDLSLLSGVTLGVPLTWFTDVGLPLESLRGDVASQINGEGQLPAAVHRWAWDGQALALPMHANGGGCLVVGDWAGD